uniref:Pentatricopeptide repeat-containing protein At4g38150-like n=2 Tax=Nicotiana TaxID=4085 RepID=A0A1S4C595_TOBAC|nr:PREDICTED: pentatricopeptide repeat-containing protein At4g38150-like [Nicotiana sylvestris]XP_016496345.1 PREDICTED: pentatricopeptide repeat-containing protein At4g38150-like [Nicotiana tabacum]
MRTTLLRKKGINIYWKYYSSLCSPKVKVNETLSSTTLPSFSSSNKYPDESTQSNYPPPPEPIPNRPLRADSRRRPGQNNENQIKSLDNQDFLKRFQLGFDHKDENPNTNPARSDTPASESPPAPPEDSDEIFKKMKETGLIPNAVAMLDGLCKDGLVQEAMKLFGRMREKGAIPEVVIYTAVVEGFCKAHKYDDAVRIFRKMQGNGIIPNAFSYSSLIRGLCQGKRLEDALEFCLEMLEAGQSPNMTTFVGLVDGYCKEKSLEDAQSMIKAVRHKGFILDEKAVREYLDKKGPFLPLVWEAILGKKASQRQSLF